MQTRRSFLATLAAATFAAPAFGQTKKLGIALGFDNYAVRGNRWKAPRLIEYAAQLKCDTLFISDIDSYDSLEDAALKEVKKKADDAGVALYAGGWSICPTSRSFNKKWGTAEEHLRLGLRVAKTLGSPVYRVILGNADDRRSEGGIKARIADTVAVLKACRTQALDMGVKVAIENHAGDMHSWELRGLIEEAGRDIAGANIDSGNGAWTLEDPHDVLENLGPVTICSSLRDDMIWETPDGATIQWTAAGDGLIDWKRWAARWLELCPKAPIQIETMNNTRNFPYKNPDFWKNYDKRPEALARFEALAKRGKPPEGPRRSDQEMLERSLKYLREEIGLGLKT